LGFPRRRGPAAADQAIPRHDRAIKKKGGAPKYTEYQGVGHDSWTPTYRDNEVLDWLFEKKKGK
jgi:predicted peptidase